MVKITSFLYKHIYKFLITFAILVVLSIVASYWSCIVKDHDEINRKKYIEPTLAILIVDGDSDGIKNSFPKERDTIKTDKAGLDSLIASYNKRVRNMEKAITEQREENNMIVDKSTAWLSFWLAILAILLAVPGIFSIIQIHRNNIKIKEETDKIESALKQNRADTENCISQAQEALKAHLINSKIAIAESKINSLMSCVNHVLEPGIYGRSSDINKLLNYYLKWLTYELSECIQYIRLKGMPEETDIKSFPIILFELQTIFDKLQMLNSDQTTSWDICEYIIFLNKTRSDLMDTSISNIEEIKNCLVELDEKTRKITDMFITSGRINTTKYDVRN